MQKGTLKHNIAHDILVELCLQSGSAATEMDSV